MSAIGSSALAVLLRSIAKDKMVYVHVKDPTGITYSGRILPKECDLGGTRIPTVTVECTDGEVVWNVLVSRLLYVDVLPLQRYSGYGVRQFVQDVAETMR